MGQRRHFYVTDADAAFLDSLPPDVTMAGLLRRAIASMRSEQAACDHPSARCSVCGVDLGHAHLTAAP